MRVVVARIGRALGVKGDLLVDVLTDEPERRLAEGCDVLLGDRVLRIESSRPHGNRLAVHFAAVDDRTAAEQLTGGFLEVDRDPSERPEDPEEYYDDDLVGLEARSVADEWIGRVTEVIHLPAQDILAIEVESGREVLVPFVREIVPHVDLDRGCVVVDAPPGLIDEDDLPAADG